MDPERVVHHEWPDSDQIYLTLDFECDFGTALRENHYQAIQHADRLVEIIDRFDVPVTVFVQTEILDHHPETIETLRSASPEVTFYPHSHTHSKRENTSTVEEVETSTSKYREFFGEDPIGYRFPNGNVRQQDYVTLVDNGYQFDASLFPSWRPNHFNNTRSPTRPHYFPNPGILEIPFTVYSDWVRIPTALSYCQVLGSPYLMALKRRSGPIVLNLHMHDLVTPDTVRELSPFYKAIYSRNPNGFSILEELLSAYRHRGRSFGLLSNIHSEIS